MTDTAAPASSEAELRALLDRLLDGFRCGASWTAVGKHANTIADDYRALKERKGWT